ncbi:hypothetical protein [Nitrospirillum sp. BR 11163]|uniref:hypothetical protein n=1 Tax=Nitrospirillum sp. BR 11163 TaxID=3104323 RepID=UPI002AFE2777|nr:hypothetical protein [Nitrospirillum sp. BR 11163]MEA1674547.1 hypothetical protein [Nitrospirillum sp. BR 11163]
MDAIRPGAWAGLPYVSHVLAEQLVRRCDPAQLTDALRQLVERRRDLDFPWYPARVVGPDGPGGPGGPARRHRRSGR